MKRYTPYAAAVILLAAGTATPALAQPIPPVQTPRPAFSPYLGLLWGGANPAFNYAALVQPQLMMQQQFSQMQQQLQMQNQMLTQPLGGVGPFSPYGGYGYGMYWINPMLGQTGHPVVFNNAGRYFYNNPAYGRGMAAGVTTGGGYVPGFNTLGRPGGAYGAGGFAPGGNGPGGGFTQPGGSALGIGRQPPRKQ